VSEEDVKPDPVFDKLGRFTPDASGIDRDDWLFRAGRASARTPRAWKWAAGVLAVSQTVTLAAWLADRPSDPTADRPPDLPPAIPSSQPVEPPASSSYQVLVRTFDPDAPPPLPPTEPPARPVVTLTAGWRGDVE
jgi:hypothetical protein